VKSAIEEFAELNERRDRIDFRFLYTPQRKDKAKSVPGASFIDADKGGPLWRMPLDLKTARTLRELFPNITFGNALKAWGREAVQRERNLRGLSAADDFPVKEMLLHKKLPKLAKSLRPYQRADTKFLSMTNVLNGLAPRLGKTREIIAAVYEADLEYGAHLVIATKTSLENPWRRELEAWQPLPVFTLSGDISPDKRTKMVADMIEANETHGGFWLVTTAHMFRGSDWASIDWSTFTIDEFRKMGLSNPTTKFHQLAMKTKVQRRWAMSGTPMGGKVANLFPVLQWLEPTQYTSKWTWYNQWLAVEKQTIYIKGGRQRQVHNVGELKPGIEEQFYASLAPNFVRRLRSEVLPQLPPIQTVDVWCDMTPKQAPQYKKFALDAEIRIEERRLTATSILAEYQRLKQFANAYCDTVTETVVPCHKCDGEGVLDDGRKCVRCLGTGDWIVLHPIPSTDSGKLEPLLERLAEAGIEAEEPSGDAQAVVTSQSKEMADMVHRHLNALGIPAEKMTGDTKGRERDRIRDVFQAGEGPRVLVMTTGTGGVAIELNRASDIHILDETWDPDDQEQVVDRLVDTNREHQVTAFFYRMRSTIDEQIHTLTKGKAVTNRTILDLRRQGFRAAVKENGSHRRNRVRRAAR